MQELAQRIGEAYPEIKVLYTSGYTDDAFLRNRLLSGQAHFISKPYTRSCLTEAVREALDKAR